MTIASASPKDEIAYLKHQLAFAETRLERAESFVFDLRCLAAKKNGGHFGWERAMGLV
jgi:hypothetical protein